MYIKFFASRKDDSISKVYNNLKWLEKTNLLFVFTSLIHSKEYFKQWNTSCSRSKLPGKRGKEKQD